MNIGIISDTHGLVRPEVYGKLQDCKHIFHAGDIGKQEVIHQLADIAPVTAIRGNVDTQTWAQQYPETMTVSLAAKQFYLIHNLKELSINPEIENSDIIVSGHSHRPLIETRNNVLYINPGSAGPRRFSLPITLATLEIRNDNMDAKIIQLTE